MTRCNDQGREQAGSKETRRSSPRGRAVLGPLRHQQARPWRSANGLGRSQHSARPWRAQPGQRFSQTRQGSTHGPLPLSSPLQHPQRPLLSTGTKNKPGMNLGRNSSGKDRLSSDQINASSSSPHGHSYATAGERTARGEGQAQLLTSPASAASEQACATAAPTAHHGAARNPGPCRGGLEGPAGAHRLLKAEISSLQDFKRKPLLPSKLPAQPKAAVEKLPTCSYCYRILARQTADLQLEEVFVGLSSAAY